MASISARLRSSWRSPGLPWVRFTSVVIFFVALDSLICVALWLGGGNSSYLRHSVNDFSFSHSTFDLAVVAVVRGLLLVLCLYRLERYSLLTVSARGRAKRSSALKFSRIFRAGYFLTVAGSIIYIVIKGSAIIHEIANRSWYSVNADTRMHTTYKALCVVSLVFPLCEAAVGVASWYFLRRQVHVRRVELLINTEEGEEEEEEEGEKKKKKKADLKRLFLLAKPVSTQLTIIHSYITIKIWCVCELSPGIPTNGSGNYCPGPIIWHLLPGSLPLWPGHRLLPAKSYKLVYMQ